MTSLDSSLRREDELIAAAYRELDLRESRQACEASLIEFLRGGWKYIDPNPYVDGWHLEAIAEHLEAVARGEIKRLIINVPPRTSKSSLVSVAFPAWLWAQGEYAPLSGPHVQVLSASYASSLSIRDSVKCRRLITSPWYQERWGSRVQITSDQNAKQRFDNSAGGYRLATSVGGALTGEGGALIIVDDAHNASEMESDLIRQSTIEWWDNAMSTRLNDPKTGAYVVVMQRLHEGDLTGHILDKGGDEWCHLMLPMRYEPDRHCSTIIGWEDPRTEAGELLCETRFGKREVDFLERSLGPYQSAGQLQQRPSPAGGGIIKREWWRLWDDDEAMVHGVKPGAYPAFDYVIASLDGAYTEKTENDPSALTVWGVWQRSMRLAKSITDPVGERINWGEDYESAPAVMLMSAWEKRLPIHGPEIERLPGETDAEYRVRTQGEWGLVEHVQDACKRFRVDLLLIEGKGPGISVAQEIKRLNRYNDFGVRLVDPGKSDKVARAYAVQAMFSGGQIYAPDRSWADQVITQFEQFPRAAHDDLVDSTTQALRYLRDAGLLARPTEVAQEALREMTHRSPTRAVYET